MLENSAGGSRRLAELRRQGHCDRVNVAYGLWVLPRDEDGEGEPGTTGSPNQRITDKEKGQAEIQGTGT